jgi:phage shock protein E
MIELIKRLFKPNTNLTQLIKEGALIVDVRTVGEYMAGHIPGSRNIPLDKIKNETTALKMLNKPVITVCRSGNRSGIAKSILSNAGIEAYNGGAGTNLEKQL